MMLQRLNSTGYIGKTYPVETSLHDKQEHLYCFSLFPPRLCQLRTYFIYRARSVARIAFSIIFRVALYSSRERPLKIWFPCKNRKNVFNIQSISASLGELPAVYAMIGETETITTVDMHHTCIQPISPVFSQGNIQIHSLFKCF